MGIKKYFATKDTTISDAFREGLSHRATGSNMGQSDVLEIFSIYGQSMFSSSANSKTLTSELSRVLIEFPVSGSDLGEIYGDRLLGTVPVSGSVNFFLRMFNAKHRHTIPNNTMLNIYAVSASWDEGRGLDMEGYRDKDAANWINANSNLAAATLANAIDCAAVNNDHAFTLTSPTTMGGDGVTYTFKFVANTAAVNDGAAGNIYYIARNGLTDAQRAIVCADAINGIANANAGFSDGDVSSVNTVDLKIKATAPGTGGGATIDLEFENKGLVGNGHANVLASTNGFAGTKILEGAFTGGDGAWTTPGGDYHTASYVPGTTLPMYGTTLVKGPEDIEIDVTSMIEEWIDGREDIVNSRQNYGFGIHLTQSQEAYYSSSLGQNTPEADGVLDNLLGAQESYYTKKLFARGTEFFFKRPVLEARWDSSKKDNRGNFYFSSSLAPATDNLNSLYMYNFTRGRLQDIGGDTSQLPTLKIYAGTNTSPSATQLTLKHSTLNTDVTSILATRIEKGIYSASFAITSSADTSYLWDVWEHAGNEAHTGTLILPKSYGSSDYNPYTKCITKITNLKSEYNTKETARFRLFVRGKDWSPTIYTKASADIENKIIENAYYKIFRVYDKLEIISYGTASSTQHTRLSHDVSGNYFDLDMSTLEEDYMYGIRFLYKINDIYQEQKETFKFRITEEV